MISSIDSTVSAGSNRPDRSGCWAWFRKIMGCASGRGIQRHRETSKPTTPSSPRLVFNEIHPNT